MEGTKHQGEECRVRLVSATSNSRFISLGVSHVRGWFELRVRGAWTHLCSETSLSEKKKKRQIQIEVLKWGGWSGKIHEVSCQLSPVITVINGRVEC